MIFVTLGTQNNSFERLIKKIDELKLNNIINDKVIIQAGYSNYEPKSDIEIFDFKDRKEIDNLIHQAKYIITHAGVGSIINCLKQNKKVIAVARLSKYHEHVNDHQKQIVKIFDEKKYIIGIENVEDLESAINMIENFKPIVYMQDNSKMINLVDDFIEKNLT